MKRKISVLLLIALLFHVTLGIRALPLHAAVIGDWAHKDEGLTHVNIPADVTEIGTGAYANNQLRYVVIPESVSQIKDWAFEKNPLSYVFIEGTDTTIGNNAFAKSTSGSGLTVVGHVYSTAQAFATNQGYGFLEMQGVYMEQDLLYIDIGAGQASIILYVGSGEDVVIPEQLGELTVTDIQNGAFRNKGITSIVLPNSLKSIGVLAFADNKIKGVTIPDHVTNIGAWAFERNEIENVILGTGLTKVETGVFSRNNLDTVIVPAEITSIGAWAFERNKIKRVLIGGNATAIDTNAFSNNTSSITMFGYAGSTAQTYATNRGHTFKELQLLIDDHGMRFIALDDGNAQVVQYKGPGGAIAIPAQIGGFTVTEIWDKAFLGKGLTSVELPEGLVTIGGLAFASNALTKITIPDHVTSIGEWAFERNKLEQVTFGASLTQIANGVFAYNVLRFVEIPNTITVIGEWAFQNNLIYDLQLSSALKWIKKGAFLNNQLKKVRIPASVDNVGEWAFLYSPLRTVIIDGATTQFGNDPFVGGYTTPEEVIMVGTSGSPAQVHAGLKGYRFYESHRDEGYHYIVDEENKALIIDYTGDDKRLDIPQELGGYVVTAIGAAAFSYNSLEEVTIPPSVTEIKASAFQYNRITRLTLSVELREIGSMAFISNQLTHVRIPKLVQNIDKWAFLYNPFQQIIFEGATTTIDDHAFVLIPDGEAGITIAGYVDSTAKEHADTNGFTFYDITTIPEVQFSIDGMPIWSQSDSLDMQLTVLQQYMDGYYQWSNDEAAPAWDDGLLWKSFTSGDAIPLPTDSGIWYLHVRVVNFIDQANDSRSSSFYIDNDAPTVSLSALPLTVTQSSVTVTADVYEPTSSIAILKWSIGSLNDDDFAHSGTDFTDTFTVDKNGVYTVYAEDMAGNATLATIEITNIYHTRPIDEEPVDEAPIVEEEGDSDDTTQDESATQSAASPEGGTFELNEVIVSIPENAVEDWINLKVSIVPETEQLPISNQIRSKVYEITKDKQGKFLKMVKITLPFQITKEQLEVNGQRLGLFWFDEDEREWVELEQVEIDWQTYQISGYVDHFTKFAALAMQQASLSDDSVGSLVDIKGHLDEQSITRLVQIGSVTGYPDGTFRPDQFITRAEFSTILVRALSLGQVDEATFQDMVGHWAQRYVAAAAAYGIVTGYPDGSFNPDAFITRDEIAAIIIRAFDFQEPNTNKQFMDEDAISEWARRALYTVIENGIIMVHEDGYVAPSAYTTRAEAVNVIVRALEKGSFSLSSR